MARSCRLGALAISVLALCAFAAGCGQDEDPMAPAIQAACAAFRVDDAECKGLGAESTFVGYAVYVHLIDLATGDAGGACSRYTDELRRHTARLVDGSRSCAQTLRRVNVVASERAVSQATDTATISVKGESSTVRFAGSADRQLVHAAGGTLTLLETAKFSWQIAHVQDESRGGALP